MLKFANKYPGYILILTIAISFFLANGLRVINYPPRSIHQWRQSDCLAYAKTYYQRGTGIFTPSTYNLAGKDGRVASEFPIIYFVAGELFKIFGFHYFILRGLVFGCFLLGIFYLYKCMNIWMKPSIFTIFPLIILATSPFYYYYALNYLPNVPAISFSFGGLYYLLYYEKKMEIKYLIFGTLFFMLAISLKPTDGGLVWLAYCGVMGIEYIKGKLNNKITYGLMLSVIIIIASFYGWYKYVDGYNNINGNHQNLQSIYPIWDMIQKDIDYVYNERILGFWAASYQQRNVLYLMILSFVIFIVRWPVLNIFLRRFSIYCILLTLIYDILWYKAFSDHDYYQLINVIPCIFLFITIFEWYANKIEPNLNKYVKLVVGSLLLILVTISIYHNKNIQNERYSKHEFCYFDPDIYEVEPYLRQLGIKPNDNIVSVPDQSPNITLAAYGTQGYSESFNNDYYNINLFKQRGAKYLIINDSNYIHKQLYGSYTTKLIGKFHNNIFIYDIR